VTSSGNHLEWNLSMNRIVRLNMFIGWAALSTFTQPLSAAERLNVLMMTTDDMSCDSVGVFGCRLKNRTPNMDGLAAESLRFLHAQAQVGNCVPSRNLLLSGRYPHNNRVEDFYQVVPAYAFMRHSASSSVLSLPLFSILICGATLLHNGDQSGAWQPHRSRPGFTLGIFDRRAKKHTSFRHDICRRGTNVFGQFFGLAYEFSDAGRAAEFIRLAVDNPGTVAVGFGASDRAESVAGLRSKIVLSSKAREFLRGE
jgi:hypothetical protein